MGRAKKSKKSNRGSRKIADLLKTKRAEKNLSQNELARLLGYASPQYVSDWERAYSSVPLAKFPELAKILGLDRDRLFELHLEFHQEQLELALRAEYRAVLGKKA